MNPELEILLTSAFAARAAFIAAPRTNAFRLFAGFHEGAPQLVLDVYGTTLVVQDHADGGAPEQVEQAIDAAFRAVPGLEVALVKLRDTKDEQLRRGEVRRGHPSKLATVIEEEGVRYALDLRLNRDASLYLDTRSLRRWLKGASAGKRVLNLFAYTGSLGVAAMAGGARQVVHVDRDGRFLQLAQRSHVENRHAVVRGMLRSADFFIEVGRLKAQQQLFDVVIVDPPFFSETESGRVHLVDDAARVLDKVRPLVAHEGALVLVNNALFLPGEKLNAELTAREGPWFKVEQRIDIDSDVTGTEATRVGTPPISPAPWNHSTKVAVCRLTRKDGRTAS